VSEKSTSTDSRRRAARFPCPGAARIHFEDAQGVKRTAYGALEEVSESGLSLRCQQEVPVDVRAEVTVAVESPSISLHGEVRHCTPTDGGFLVGVLLDS